MKWYEMIIVGVVIALVIQGMNYLFIHLFPPCGAAGGWLFGLF